MALGTGSARFALELDGKVVLRCEGLHASPAPGMPPRPLRPEELFVLLMPPTIAGGGYAAIAARPRAPRSGGQRWGDITLKRGVCDGSVMWRWNSTAQPRNAILIALAADGQPVGRYNLTNAWPMKWSGPSAGRSGEVPVASLDIAYQGMQRL